MSNSFEVVIVGLGAMGSAAAYHLARKGARVLGLDQFIPPHSFGSSHGQSRIIREAYFEHPLYVPLVQRAYQLWAKLEHEIGAQLFHQTGGLMIGPPEGILVTGARRSAQVHHLSHEVISTAEVRRRFPAFHPDDEMVAVWEPRAGILFPERCIAAHLNLARQHGAALQFEERVTNWKAEGEGVRVMTHKGHYQTGKLILTAGAWLSTLTREVSLPITVERQVLAWFKPKAHSEYFKPERCPIYIWEYAPQRIFYGFPDLGDGVKVARHHEGELTMPESVRREVKGEDVETIRALLRCYLPDVDGELQSAAVCMYTNTPDSHFLLDFHPIYPHVFIASPCSGHGFKFSSVIGEILADLLMEGNSPFDLSLFKLERLKAKI